MIVFPSGSHNIPFTSNDGSIQLWEEHVKTLESMPAGG